MKIRYVIMMMKSNINLKEMNTKVAVWCSGRFWSDDPKDQRKWMLFMTREKAQEYMKYTFNGGYCFTYGLTCED